MRSGSERCEGRAPQEAAAEGEHGAERAEHNAESSCHDEHVVERLVESDGPRFVEQAVARRVAH